jgi:UDP-N-acetylglucosamine 2-epimerase (non-hydrolysing)/GDP/UDP-N,N'-diacetylbacillosamine 2-epimerase (hydrolysing)
LDNFVAHTPMEFASLNKSIGFPQEIGDYALVLFHPDPSEHAIAGDICRNILLELKAAGLGACIGYPNTDPSNRDIINALDEFKGERRFFFYRALRRDEFICIYRRSSFIIGNSSSGIMEAASIPIPAINVGLRQRGRHAGKNVIFVDSNRTAIREAIVKVRDPAFRTRIAGMANPYGDGRSSEGAHELIVNLDFASLRLKTEDPLQLRDQRLS